MKKLHNLGALFQITDEGGNALSDVLLSLSGGKQYRSNHVTKEDGSMAFIDLVSFLDSLH